MSTETTLKLFLDEGVPDSVGRVFEEHGHKVTYLNRTLVRGSSDQLVCAIADINEAVLVALDGDMKAIAKANGVGAGRYLKLGLIKLSCKEPKAAERVRSAMSLIEHEWNYGILNRHRRIFIEIGDLAIRTYR